MSYRKAALLLHGLSAGDRKWLLNQLPEEAVREISRLLNELEDLGIPKDRNMLKPALDTAQIIGKKRSLIMRLDGYAPEKVYECLKDEPSFFIRRVLGVHAWRWSSQVKNRLLQNMDKKDSRHYFSSLSTLNMSDKNETLLLEAVLEKLDGIQPAVVAFGLTGEAI